MIFAGYTGSKNPVRNRLKIQFVELDFSKLIFQNSSTDQQGVRILRPAHVRYYLGSLLTNPTKTLVELYYALFVYLGAQSVSKSK